jgi:hypothetical protein
MRHPFSFTDRDFVKKANSFGAFCILQETCAPQRSPSAEIVLQMFFVIIREHCRAPNSRNMGEIASTRGTRSDPAQSIYTPHLRASSV